MKRYFSITITGLLFIFLASCASNPYSDTNRVHKKHVKNLTEQLRDFPPDKEDRIDSLDYGEYWVGTTNFSLRKPNFVIIHHTAQDSVEHTLKTFTLPRTQVSSHYVISDDGKIYQMLSDSFRAWHAGVGKWGNNTDLNSSSIGIELDNNGFEPFSAAQINSLIKLLGVLKDRYNIPTANFIGHSDIAPTRKVDPNAFFPWEVLAEEGFGFWYDEEILASGVEKTLESELNNLNFETGEQIANSENNDIAPHLKMDPEMALRIIGYDTSDLNAAIKAFKLHFVQEEITGKLTEKDLKILYNLYPKYM